MNKIVAVGVGIVSVVTLLIGLQYTHQLFGDGYPFSKDKTLVETGAESKLVEENKIDKITVNENVESSLDTVRLIAWSTSTEITTFSVTTVGVAKDTHYYKVGSFVSGLYKGSDLIIATVPCEGMCFKDSVYYFVKGKDNVILLTSHSIELYTGDYLNRDSFVVDAATTIPELFFPETIAYNGNVFTLESGNSQNSFFDTVHKPEGVSHVFTHPLFGDVYTDSMKEGNVRSITQNGFYIRAADGTERVYSLNYNFYDKNRSMPAVVWNNGEQNTIEYSKTDRGGCGSSNYASIIKGVMRDDLVVAGKTSFNDPVYELKDVQHAMLNKVYKNDYNPVSYSPNGERNPKMPYETFVQSHPLFFWYDSFGNLIKFQRSDFIPQAECGKPVIYLYPEETTEVSVQVAPKGGFTKTEPEYGNGWNVLATKDGVLTEISTGKVYPYLFWEGRGGIYETPKKGFVVEKNNVHDFLIEKLTKLGLNDKEQFDFMEFWEPRMNVSPYYFVTFLGLSDMEKIAPLTVTPKPDTVIRILMDFTPIPEPVPVEGYTIRTPERKGFTVVEWGGVLR